MVWGAKFPHISHLDAAKVLVYFLMLIKPFFLPCYAGSLKLTSLVEVVRMTYFWLENLKTIWILINLQKCPGQVLNLSPSDGKSSTTSTEIPQAIPASKAMSWRLKVPMIGFKIF